MWYMKYIQDNYDDHVVVINVPPPTERPRFLKSITQKKHWKDFRALVFSAA